MSTDGCVLAIDLGKTWCRAALLGPSPDAPGPGSGTTAHPPSSAPVVTVPGSVGLAEDGGVRAALVAVDAALHCLARRTAKVGGRILAVGMGAAGATAAPDAAGALAAELAARTGAPAAVTSDAVSSHVGALGGSPGVVLAAGTGAVAVAVGTGAGSWSAGTVELVDGWGQWLGDEGGGAWIGQQGLRAALRAHDGRGAATTLRDLAVADFGALDQLPATLAAGSLVRATAAFAPRVLDAAERGDSVALDVVHAAAARLVETTLTAVRRCAPGGPTPVALIGGLSQAGPVLLEPWRTALAAADQDVRVVAPLGDSLSGAGRLALRTDLRHENAIIRSHPARPGTHLEDL